MGREGADGVVLVLLRLRLIALLEVGKEVGDIVLWTCSVCLVGTRDHELGRGDRSGHGCAGCSKRWSSFVAEDASGRALFIVMADIP